MPTDERVKEIKHLMPHINRPAHNIGTSEPGLDKEETPTKPLPPVEGNQHVERVTVGGEPAPAEEVEPEE